MGAFSLSDASDAFTCLEAFGAMRAFSSFNALGALRAVLSDFEWLSFIVQGVGCECVACLGAFGATNAFNSLNALRAQNSTSVCKRSGRSWIKPLFSTFFVFKNHRRDLNQGRPVPNRR